MNLKGIKSFCKEDISLIENYEKAIQSNEVWDCHHRLEIQGNKRYTRRQLIEMNLYYDRPACELIFLTHSEHTRLHFQGKNSPNSHKFTKEHRKKLSEKKIGNTNHKGCKHSEQAKLKMSLSAKNRKNRIGYNKGKHRVWNEDHTKYHYEY